MASLSPRLDSVERQICLNGDFSLWQRGVGPTTPGASITYLADRFGTAQSGYTATQQRSTDVPTQAASGYSSNYSLLVTNGTGASPTTSQYQVMSYSVEGQDYQGIHAKKIRIQFWVKSSVTGTYVFHLRNAAATRAYTTTYSIASANTWQKVALDIQLDSSGTWAFDNTIGLQLMWTLTSGSNFQSSTLNAWQTTAGTTWGATGQTQWGATTGATFQIAQVSVIPQDFTLAGASNVDIPFQRAGRTIQQELAMCQRYYEKSYEVDVAPGTAAAATGRVTVAATAQTSSIMTLGSITTFKVQKRTPPSVAFYNSGSGASGTWQYFSPGNGSPTNFSATLNLAGSDGFEISNSGSPGFPTTTAFIALGHYTADAEL